jgi:hypothetical protein
MILLLLWFPCGIVVADELPATDGTEPPGETIDDVAATGDADEEALDGREEIDENGDDTADYDVDTTIDYTESSEGIAIDGDLRPIVDTFDRDTRDGMSVSDERLGLRFRLRGDYGITDEWHVGARLAGVCFTDDCDPDWYFDSSAPTNNGLAGGQVTFDELYMNWFRTERGAFAIGRLQTRAVLRGGVYAKSLDRNDSNNVNVTWTDGGQATYRARNGWNSTLILQYNGRDGPGSIRRGQLDFDDDGARTTTFVGFENLQNWGPIAQRAFGISYLPNSLLKDGDPSGRREDYWGLVGRLMFRVPQRREGVRFRTGTEIGYAPETPTSAAANLDTSVSGLAWNIVASVMDFLPGHNFGINYAQTGAGWLLSPQYRQNEELFELRYQWRTRRGQLLEARVRWREEIEQRIGTVQKREEFDFYLRLTWEFTVKDR